MSSIDLIRNNISGIGRTLHKLNIRIQEENERTIKTEDDMFAKVFSIFHEKAIIEFQKVQQEFEYAVKNLVKLGYVCVGIFLNLKNDKYVQKMLFGRKR